MSHVYQPVMIRTLLDHGGTASIEDIARSLLAEDRSQVEYYSVTTKQMVGRVLDGLGQPMDDQGPFVVEAHYPVMAASPAPLARSPWAAGLPASPWRR